MEDHKIAFGRRSKEKVKGTRNDYKMVAQDNYILTDGQHEAIIPDDLWNDVQTKRIKTGHRCDPLSCKEKTHPLSGILRCPECGGPGYQMFRQKNNERLQKLYAQIEDIDERIAATTKKLSEFADEESSLALFNEKLIDYEKLFAAITPEEKKDFFKYFFKSITIYPDFEDATQIVKSVQIYFRAYKNQSEIKEEILNAKSTKKVLELMNDESQVKTIYTEIDLQEFGLDKLLESRAKEALTLTYMPRSRKRGPYNSHKVIYKKIQQYVKEKYGFTAHTAYIAEIKRDFGCEMVEAYNAVEVLKHKKHHPTPQMREAITDALIHFGVISSDHEPQNFDVGEVTYKMIEEYVKKNFNLVARSRNIAEVKRMYGLKMINSRSTDTAQENKRPSSKEMVHAIEMALVYFKIIDEGQVTEM